MAAKKTALQNAAPSLSVRKFNKTVHLFDFGNLSSSDFERLVLAFLFRRWAWRALDWFGQLGDDDGRDILGIREDERGRDEKVVVACANWRRLTTQKALEDLDKIAASVQPPPDVVLVVAGGKVSAALKDKVAIHAQKLNFHRVEVWSGPEFEERLRAYADTVARRFFNGEELPDDASALRAWVMDTPTSEEEGLRLVARLFDRPAFQTPFGQESSLPAFRQALVNTIEALNTGLWRARDGAQIGRVPSKADFTNPSIRAAMNKAVDDVVQLRATFDDLQRRKLVVPCSCTQLDCPTFTMDAASARELNTMRVELLEDLQRVVPEVLVAPALRRA